MKGTEMKTKLTIISVVSLFTISIPSYSFIISCRSLIHPVSRNRILILGDNRKDGTPHERIIDDFLLGLKGLQKVLKKPINCFVELSQNNVEKMENIKNKTFKILAEEALNDTLFDKNLVKFIPCDQRDSINYYMHDIFDLLSNKSTKMKSKVDIPISFYYRMIEDNIAYIEREQIKLGEFIGATILEPIKKSLLNTKQFLTNVVFRGESESSNLYDAILKYINTESKGNFLKEKNSPNIYTNGGLWSHVIGTMDYTFAEAVFFCCVMRDQRTHSTPNLTILIADEIHAEKVALMLYQIYYKLDRARSWEPPVKISDIDYRSEVLVEMPHYFQSLIYHSSLLAHPITETETFERYSKEYKRSRVTSAELIKQKIHSLTEKLGKLDTSSNTSTCNNPLCARQITTALLKKCGGCKRVSYCSLPCQKDDWKRHKLICKKRNNS
jgi:hypothetical protein